MAFLYGRAGRLTAKNGGFRPGQCNSYTFAPWNQKSVTCAPSGETAPTQCRRHRCRVLRNLLTFATRGAAIAKPHPATCACDAGYTTTAAAWRIKGHGQECGRNTAEDWLGTKTVDECATACTGHLYFVHATQSDSNCKCVQDNCEVATDGSGNMNLYAITYGCDACDTVRALRGV